MSDSLILDAQIEYSCDDPKDFDCFSNRGMVEGEHCYIPERGLVSTDSILATEATKFIDREAAYSHTGNVSNQDIVSGDEGKLFDDEPPQPSPILHLYILDVSEEEESFGYGWMSNAEGPAARERDLWDKLDDLRRQVGNLWNLTAMFHKSIS
ncbi:hypothetical protein SASPL_123228 [Salvia splendens]|uniref:Uncharacterized protein n=1 Tax=Salvia splendens TaxID=180675 RepID=A0A8X8XNN0_SALSN|nr:hypothetical protein SASPL_123228 [Salvia splendens]